MALTSPRFRNETELSRVEAGQVVLRRGSTGRHVHLIQMALIDLGFAMPISTASRDYSPDGVYGAETASVVQAFQRSTPGLSPDGEVGQFTMRALDGRFPRFGHRINLHFRSLSLTDIAFDTLLGNTQRVYAQYGIEARFASGESLGLSPAQERRFTVIRQDCEWVMNSGDFADLHRLGSSIPANDIGVFIVSQFQQAGVDGCGGHAVSRPACAITHNCMAFTPPHEIGHVLLTSAFPQVHSASARNLMFDGNWSSSPPTLTERHLRAIRASPLCRAV